MRITVDTNFLVSATQWDYSVAHKLLKRFIEQDVKLFATKEILDEFSDVLQRDFKYSKDEVSNVIEKLLFIVELTEPTKKVDIIKELNFCKFLYKYKYKEECSFVIW